MWSNEEQRRLKSSPPVPPPLHPALCPSCVMSTGYAQGAYGEKQCLPDLRRIVFFILDTSAYLLVVGGFFVLFAALFVLHFLPRSLFAVAQVARLQGDGADSIRPGLQKRNGAGNTACQGSLTNTLSKRTSAFHGAIRQAVHAIRELAVTVDAAGGRTRMKSMNKKGFCLARGNILPFASQNIIHYE